jgi:large subunit ribosomal protein L18
MPKWKTQKDYIARRHKRLRKKVVGTAERPRMCVSLSSKHLYVQFIDDAAAVTLAASSTLDSKFRETGLKVNVAGAAALGKIAAEKAVAAGVSTVVFDRGGFQYHGRVKAIAEAAREAGLKF